ncbi:MAG: hypothetical protein LH630_09890, partial [Actinomycetia bacterium]|nr:hypothetical protein [Actinomycetes bacterium]
DRVHLAGWPWVSAGFLVVGSISIAVFIEQLTDDVVVSDVDAVIVALSLVVAAVALAVSLRGSPHTVPVNVAVLVVWGLAVAIAGTSGLWTPGERPWAAGVVLVAGLAALLPRLLVVTPSWTRRTLALVGAMVIGAAVGLAVAPWLDPLDDYLTAAAWAGQAWPTWRGLVAGLAFVALLVGTAWLLPKWLAANTRTNEGAGSATVSVGGAVLLPAATALATWVFASLNDLDTATAGGGFYGYQAEPTPEVFQRQMVIALTVLALGVLVMVLLHRLPAWSVWAVPALAIPAALIRLDTLSIDASADPEVYGLALAIPAGVAAIGWWWLRRPQPTPTWQTMAPPFVLALAPSTTALLDETANRWFLSSDVGDEYQVRMVGLLAIGIAAAVIGAWQRWGGLFFPGLALALVVVGIEFIDLGRSLPQWLAFAVAGAVLIAAGARWEWVRQRGRVGATWVRSLT